MRRRPLFRIPEPLPELDTPPAGRGHNQPHLPFEEFRRRLQEECRIPRLIGGRGGYGEKEWQEAEMNLRSDSSAVFNFVFKLCGRNRQYAADVTGDVAIVAMDKWQTFNPELPCRGKDPFRSWLFKIAQNQYKQFVKNAKKFGSKGGAGGGTVSVDKTQTFVNECGEEKTIEYSYDNTDHITNEYTAQHDPDRDDEPDTWAYYAQEFEELRRSIDCTLGAMYAEHIKQVQSWSTEDREEVMNDLRITVRLAYVKADTPEDKAALGNLMSPVDRFKADAWEREIAGNKLSKAERDKGLKKAQRDEARLRGETSRGALANRKSRATALAAEITP
jgi:DNA-directed RNA polymerase specialized sigma24 family protein